MAAPDLRYVVLGEDSAHGNFVRRWLLSEGVPSRSIRLVPWPAGTGGAGDQHVREKYPDEVADYRRRANAQRVALVVVTDADAGTVRDRQHQLDDELAKKQGSQRTDAERIAVLVPKQNIETWLRKLLGSPTSEATNYKPSFKGRTADACAQCGPRFRDFLRSAHSEADLPSMAIGRDEAQRLA